MNDYFSYSHALDQGEQGSLGPAVSAWEMVQQNFRQQFRVDSAMALDQELDNRWRESLQAAGLPYRPSGNPYVMRDFARFVQDGTMPSRGTASVRMEGDIPISEITPGPSPEFEELRRANEAIRQLNNPRIKTFEQILQEVAEMQRGVEEETISMSQRATTWGNIAGFAGSIAGSFSLRDPLNIITAPVGVGRTIAARVASDMVLAGSVTAVTEFTDVAPNRALVGLPERNPFLNIAAATIGAGVIRGGIEGVRVGAGRLRNNLRGDDLDFDLRDAQLQAMFGENSHSPSARAAASLLDDTIFIERNNPYGEGYAATERFIAEIRAVQRAMNGEPMTAVGRVLPPMPFESIRKAADFEIVREQRPDIYAKMEAAQARVAELNAALEGRRTGDGSFEDNLSAPRSSGRSRELASPPEKSKTTINDASPRYDYDTLYKALVKGDGAREVFAGAGISPLVMDTKIFPAFLGDRIKSSADLQRLIEPQLSAKVDINISDDIFNRAVQSVTESGTASTSGLQKQLGLGYNEAARLMERLEREGIVSAPNSSGVREVLREVDGTETVPKVSTDDLNAAQRAANKEYQEAYKAVEAESVRLREAQARAEAAQQGEASNILAQISEGRPLLGPLLRYDNVGSLVERINKINDTLDEASVAAFARQTDEAGTVRDAWLGEDGRVDIGLREPVDPDFRIITDEGEMTVRQIMDDLQDDVDLVNAVKVCSI